MQITKRHLSFLQESQKVFNAEILRTTHINDDGDLIALRYGANRDCIKIIEIGEEVGFFSQMISATDGDQFIAAVGKVYDKDLHELRPEIGLFAEMMERQLRENDHKDGWENTSFDYLFHELHKNLHGLKVCVSHSEFRRRCANIANFAMMLSDNDRREEASRS